ncbi:MAG: bifunctional diaminohydroxyphosphoribosylaminopyrimidine deaminase/5-amino-6-(5-phosphoribosylamino)uracil reductase RibD [Tepidisphaerales bacterium]
MGCCDGRLDDVAAMELALLLAKRGRGSVEPNPMVGCVVVRDGRLIGWGYHARVGEAHAEPAALADVRARGFDPAGATVYVTLEPCCHTNKRTPPCVPALLDAEVGRVVVGTLDPNPAVNGEGVRQLREAGVTVDLGPTPQLQAACRQLIAPFVANTVLGRPFVTVKWAQDREGRIARSDGTPMQITGPAATEAMHRYRALIGRFGGIAIGGETLRRDDPLLTARPRGTSPATAVQPRRIVFTRKALLPAAARLFHSPGGEVLTYRVGTDVATLAEALQDLLQRGVHELLVESGGGLAVALSEARLVDRYWLLRPHDGQLMPSQGVEKAASLVWCDDVMAESATVLFDEDVLLEAWDRRSGTFAAAEPSADIRWLSQLPREAAASRLIHPAMT